MKSRVFNVVLVIASAVAFLQSCSKDSGNAKLLLPGSNVSLPANQACAGGKCIQGCVVNSKDAKEFVVNYNAQANQPGACHFCFESRSQYEKISDNLKDQIGKMLEMVPSSTFTLNGQIRNGHCEPIKIKCPDPNDPNGYCKHHAAVNYRQNPQVLAACKWEYCGDPDAPNHYSSDADFIAKAPGVQSYIDKHPPANSHTYKVNNDLCIKCKEDDGPQCGMAAEHPGIAPLAPKPNTQLCDPPEFYCDLSVAENYGQLTTACEVHYCPDSSRLGYLPYHVLISYIIQYGSKVKITPDRSKCGDIACPNCPQLEILAISDAITVQCRPDIHVGGTCDVATSHWNTGINITDNDLIHEDLLLQGYNNTHLYIADVKPQTYAKLSADKKTLEVSDCIKTVSDSATYGRNLLEYKVCLDYDKDGADSNSQNDICDTFYEDISINFTISP